MFTKKTHDFKAVNSTLQRPAFFHKRQFLKKKFNLKDTCALYFTSQKKIKEPFCSFLFKFAIVDERLQMH